MFNEIDILSRKDKQQFTNIKNDIIFFKELISEQEYQKFFKSNSSFCIRNEFTHNIGWWLLTRRNIYILSEIFDNKSNKYYKDHHFLISCTKCHPNHTEKGMDKCGADCFECHSRKKLINTPIPQHQKLVSCTKCHKIMKIENLPTPTVNPNFLNNIEIKP